MRIFFSVILLLFLFIYSLNAQFAVTEVPVHFGQYFNNPQINPARGGSESDVEFYAGNKRNSGNFSGITTAYLSAFLRLHSKRESFNVLGLNFNNDNEGQFITRNRIYASYSRHQKMSADWFLSGGISLGMYNFSIKPNPSMDAVGAATFDGSGGIWLYSDNTRLGLSVNQFNNATVRPIDQVILLNRHFYFIGEQDITIGESFQFGPKLFTRYIEANNNSFIQQWRFGGGLNFLVKDLISFGASYENKEGLYTFLGIKNINMVVGENKKNNSGKLNVDFSYFVPAKNNYRTNIQSYEFVLRYYWGQHKN